MCPPSRDNHQPHPRGANSHHLEIHPLLPTWNTFALPTTGGHIGPPLRGQGKWFYHGTFLVIQLPAGRNGQGRSLYSYYGLRRRPCYYPNKYAQPNGSSVGADPCVRPAETIAGLILVGRIRTTLKHIPFCLGGTHSYCPPRADTWVRPYGLPGNAAYTYLLSPFLGNLRRFPFSSTRYVLSSCAVRFARTESR